MEQFETKYFRGQGPVFLEELAPDGSGLGLLFIGDVSEANVEPNVERFDVRENVSGVGRTGAAGIRSVDYGLSLTMRSIRKDALAIALRALVTPKVAASVTDEQHVARLGRFIALKHVKVSAFILTDSTGVTTYVDGDDYKLHADEGMVEILDEGGIADGAEVLADYSYAAQNHLAVNPKQAYFRLIFAGMNTADSDKQVRAEFYRVQLDPSAVSMITDDVEEHELTGRVVHDTSRPDGDQLFSWKLEE
jgi:hypothetical protein